MGVRIWIRCGWNDVNKWGNICCCRAPPSGGYIGLIFIYWEVEISRYLNKNQKPQTRLGSVFLLPLRRIHLVIELCFFFLYRLHWLITNQYYTTYHPITVCGFTMNVFDHSETDALFQFSHISHSTLEHLKNVYSSLAICMCLAAVGFYVYIYLVPLLVTQWVRCPPSQSWGCWSVLRWLPSRHWGCYLVCHDPL